MMVIVTPELDVQSASHSFLALWGRRFPAELAEPLRVAHERAMTDGECRLDAIDVRTDPGHPARAISLKATRLDPADGAAPTVLISVDDVTERGRREAQFQVKHGELERSNAALAEFAHAASHDLQEPLRKIIAFADRTLQRHGEAIPPAAVSDLERIVRAAARMRRLTDGLLEAARASAGPTTFQPMSLESVVREVLDDLDMQVHEVGATFDLGALPDIQADAFQMRQLLQNLVGNALKFRRPGVAPHIAITSTLAGNHVHLSVADNGVGFAEAYRERIFGMFMRLHGRSEYEGSGIGLSLCRTIAERHGGSITATSVPGEGATFIVSLPLHQPTQSDNHE